MDFTEIPLKIGKKLQFSQVVHHMIMQCTNEARTCGPEWIMSVNESAKS